MKRRFSKRHLYELRNFIPIDALIKEHLNIPAKISEGVFRFLCPNCNEFQTSTKRKTNLGRCYRCEKNFNTIDLVEKVLGMDFVETVKYLEPLLERYKSSGIKKDMLVDRRVQLRQMLEAVGAADNHEDGT